MLKIKFNRRGRRDYAKKNEAFLCELCEKNFALLAVILINT